MMRELFGLLTVLAVATCGVIHHDSDGHKATSYQNIHIEHFHSVPTYVKKEHAHLLEHPISKGKTSSKVEVHHGGKHDHGYAIADTHTDLQHHGHEEVAHDFGGHEEAAHDFGGHDFSHYAADGGHDDHGYAAIAAGHGGEEGGHEGGQEGGHEGGGEGGHEGHADYSQYAALQHEYGGGEETEGHGEDGHQHQLQASHHQHLEGHGLGHYH